MSGWFAARGNWPVVDVTLRGCDDGDIGKFGVMLYEQGFTGNTVADAVEVLHCVGTIMDPTLWAAAVAGFRDTIVAELASPTTGDARSLLDNWANCWRIVRGDILNCSETLLAMDMKVFAGMLSYT